MNGVQLPPNHRIHRNSNSKWNIIIFNMTLMTVKLVWQYLYVGRDGEQRKESLSDGGEGIERKEDFRADFRKSLVMHHSVIG